ncbi:hypothetical protein P9112_014322 [Eukaryota sp. TZLM1-RC]
MSTILSYLSSLSPPQQIRLYHHPIIVLSFVKVLPSLHRSFLLRLLWFKKPIPLSAVKLWFSSHHQLNSVLHTLTALSFLVSDHNGIVLQPQVASAIRISFLNPSSITIPRSTLPMDTISHSQLRFDTVIRLLTGELVSKSSRSTRKSIIKQEVDHESVSSTIASLLYSADLSSTLPSTTTSAVITASGFRFLLTPRREQLWTLLVAVLRSFEDFNVVCDTLSFLFEISNNPTNSVFQATKSENPELNSVLIKFCGILDALGLVVSTQLPNGNIGYVTTEMTELLLSSINHEQIFQHVNGHDDVSLFITVETNFKIFVHSSDPLILSVLHLFLHVNHVLPGLICCSLSRESVTRAYQNGITSDVIVNFLKHHARPSTLQRKEPIPKNVIEHILLWESELSRIKSSECTLFFDFAEGVEVFDRCVVAAREAGAELLVDQVKRMLVVKAEKASVVRNILG